MRRVALRGAARLVAVALLTGPRVVSAQDPNPRYSNLRVLPVDISDAELGRIMLDNLRGLGLPRRAGEGCLFCHAGSLDVPRGSWDYASDEKPMKEKARVMMAMVRQINEDVLPRLDHRVAPDLDVGCYSCHAGRTNPLPLPDRLISEYRAGGIDAVRAFYRAARARYYEADAYDFRVSTLIEVADRLASEGAPEDAMAVHELNLEYHEDDPTAHGGLIRLHLEQALRAGGPGGMLARYDQLKAEMPPTGFVPLTLDVLAWSLYRSGEEDTALRLFELNHREHPDAFAANESLAYAVFGSISQEEGLEIARRWRAEHPDHEGGRQLLTELLRMRGAPSLP